MPGHPDHVIYVWFDALTNYLTGVGSPAPTSEAFREFWPADLHIIGKDIIRFHTVYWPAFLMSAGIPLPRSLRARLRDVKRREDEQVGRQRRRPACDLIDAFGVDPVRYFLLREVPFGHDGNFSEDAIIGRINADLANDLGNLAQRSLSMVNKNLDGIAPQPGEFTDADRELLALADALLPTVRAHFDVPSMNNALEAIWLMLGAANRYFSAQEPWVLRSPTDRGPGPLSHRALHDARGGAHRGASGATGDAGLRGQAARSARATCRSARLRRDRHTTDTGHTAADAGRGVPPLRRTPTRYKSRYSAATFSSRSAVLRGSVIIRS